MEQSNEPFSIELIKQIVAEDFGGFQGIVRQEEIYQSSVTSKYIRLLRSEMLKSFSNSTLLNHLAVLFVCYGFYSRSLRANIDLKPLIILIVIMSFIPGLYYLFKRFVLDRQKYKVSVKYDFLHKCWMIGVLLTNTLNWLFVSQHSFFELSNHQKVIALILIIFSLNVFVRSFIKIYDKRIKILAV